MDNLPHRIQNCKYPKSLMFMWYNGDLFGLIPFRSDFINYFRCDFPIKDVMKAKRVVVIGTTLQKFIGQGP